MEAHGKLEPFACRIDGSESPDERKRRKDFYTDGLESTTPETSHRQDFQIFEWVIYQNNI